MSFKTFFFSAIVSLGFVTTQAQTAIPEGFAKGSITLPNNTVINGYIKNNIKKSAAVVFMDEAGTKKTYEGNAINGVSINGDNYTCISGDFFKIICAGKLNFLQKASNAAGTTTYNGSEPVLIAGTEGKPGDYFSYTNNHLKILNKKSMESFISNELNGCSAAVEKAKAIDGDIARLKEAVDIYNSSSN
ncbi:hypothetical protein [Ferruginibacter sp.]